MEFINPYTGTQRRIVFSRRGRSTNVRIETPLKFLLSERIPGYTTYIYHPPVLKLSAWVTRYHLDPEDAAVGRREALKKLLSTYKDGRKMGEVKASPTAREYRRRVWAAYYEQYPNERPQKEKLPTFVIEPTKRSFFGRIFDFLLEN